MALSNLRHLLSRSVFNLTHTTSSNHVGGIRPPTGQILWKIGVPEKVKYFLYLSMNDKILTKSNLVKRGWKGIDRCSLCASTSEIIDHLFLQCSFSKPVWSILFQNLQSKELPQMQSLLWHSWRLEASFHISQVSLDALIAATI